LAVLFAFTFLGSLWESRSGKVVKGKELKMME